MDPSSPFYREATVKVSLTVPPPRLFIESPQQTTVSKPQQPKPPTPLQTAYSKSVCCVVVVVVVLLKREVAQILFKLELTQLISQLRSLSPI